MKHWKKGLCGLLAAVLMAPAGLAAPVNGEKGLSDLEGHWAQKEVEAAVASGWVDGYPDGSFKPEKSITRAEFTKMLLDAIHLTPDSETVAWMKENALTDDIWGNPTEYTPKLYDMSGHWLTSQGWLDAALYSGMVVPDDYNGKNFRPEKAIARYEIALMTDRALGLVYPASQPVEGELPFTDKEEILDWMKGYVHEAVQAGILEGYPDNTFRPNQTSTRAEAVVMIQRMLHEMEQGLNPEIHLVVQYAEEGTVLWEEETDEIQLQIVDNVVYASIKDIYDVERRLIKDHGTEHTNNPLWNINNPYWEMWWPIQQIYCIGMDSQTCAFFDYRMGDTGYVTESGLARQFHTPARALYGEVMIPVCDLSHPDSQPQGSWYQDDWHGAWDADTNTLTLLLYYHVQTFVGS